MFFHLSLKVSFSIACLAGLPAINCLNFCLSGNILICLSFLEESFTGYRILHWQSFSFSTFNVSSYCLLVSIVSDEKLAVNLVEKPLYLMSHFSLAPFSMIPFSLSFESLIIICLDEGLLTFITLGFFCLFLVYVDSCFISVYIKFDKLSDIISSNILF